jgi:RecA-family ATPase
MNIVSAKELLEMNIDKIPFLVDGLLPKGQIGCLVGQSDLGKSTLLRGLGLQVAANEEYIFNCRVNATNLRCLMASTEDDKMAAAFFVTKNNNRFKYSPEITSRMDFVFDFDSNFFPILKNRLAQVSYDLIILDNLADLFSLARYTSLNDAMQVRAFLQPYAALAGSHGCTIIFIHHLKKGREKEEPTKNNLNGSQAIEAKSRFILELRKDLNDPAKKHLCITKGNSFSNAQKQLSIELVQDENLVFEPTGNRVLLDQLVFEPRNEAYEKVKELKGKGFTHRDIAKATGFKSPGTITKILSKDIK